MAARLANRIGRPNRSPWQNPYVERVIGSIRRECLDHVIVVNERHLRRVLRTYMAYYQQSRTHLALGKDAPVNARSNRTAASWCDRQSAVCTTATNDKPPNRAWLHRACDEAGCGRCSRARSTQLQNGIRPPTFSTALSGGQRVAFSANWLRWKIEASTSREILAKDRRLDVLISNLHKRRQGLPQRYRANRDPCLFAASLVGGRSDIPSVGVA
jgi:hypothetical protein